MSNDKIYSRPRIKLPKIKFRKFNFKSNKYKNNENIINNDMNNIRNTKKFRITIIFVIAAFTAKIILDAIFPIFDTLCESKAKSIATLISNEEATNVMKKYSYDELFSIEKDSNNNITMIKSKIKNINEITSEIAQKIQIRLDNKEREDIQIALREFYRI